MKKKSVIITVVIAVLVIIGIVVALVLTNNNKKEEPTPEPTATPKPTAVTKEEVTITFDTDGVEEIESIKVEKGKTATLPTPKEREEYEFRGWYNGDEEVTEETVFNEDVTLKALWTPRKVIQATPTPTPSATPKATPTSTPKPTPTPKTTYTCPDGYQLKDTNKCVKTVAAEDTCPLGWKVVKGDRVNPNSPNKEGTRTCKKEYVEGYGMVDGLYDKQPTGPATCLYSEIETGKGRKDYCTSAQVGGVWYSGNSGCYRKITQNQYTMECASGEKRFGNQEVAPGDGGGCYQVTSPIKKCPDGYKENTGYGVCADVKEATAK